LTTNDHGPDDRIIARAVALFRRAIGRADGRHGRTGRYSLVRDAAPAGRDGLADIFVASMGDSDASESMFEASKLVSDASKSASGASKSSADTCVPALALAPGRLVRPSVA